MKLRIAKIISNNVPQEKFIVQCKDFLLWDDLYYNPKTDMLQENVAIVNGEVIDRAVFDDFHEASKYAKKFKYQLNNPEKITETWRI